jgi:hypothetical protein
VEEGHGEVAVEDDGFGCEVDADGEGFDEPLFVVAVVEGAGAEEEG